MNVSTNNPLLQAMVWCRRRMSARTFVMLTAFLIGAVTGGMAWLLKLMIRSVTALFQSGTTVPDFYLLLIPVSGIVLTGIFVRYILRDNVEHGVDQLVIDMHDRQPYLRRRLCFGSMIASTLTLGFGGSAGSEGPIAYTGAAIGSNVGRMMKMPRQIVMAMVGVGAGAGIAGIFKSPIGGAFFTLEVLKMPLSTTLVLALLIACITSSLVAYSLSGCTYDLTWHNIPNFDPSLLPGIIVLAIFCGLYSVYYAGIMKRLGSAFIAISNPWVKNIVSGLLLAIAVFCFPSLYGEGYGIIGSILNGDPTAIVEGSILESEASSTTVIIVAAALILLIKCWAACSANSGGGVAGDFAPTLFAGAMAGLLFATVANAWAGAHYPASVMAVVGMASVMSGAIRAPLMAIFLTTEMTDSYSIFLPIVVGATVSWGIVKALTPGAFYEIPGGRMTRDAINKTIR